LPPRVAGLGPPLLGVVEHQVRRGRHVRIHRRQPRRREQRVDQRTLAALGLPDHHDRRLGLLPAPHVGDPSRRFGVDLLECAEQAVGGLAQHIRQRVGDLGGEEIRNRHPASPDLQEYTVTIGARSSSSPSRKPTSSVPATVPSSSGSVVATVPPASCSDGSNFSPSGRRACTPTPANPSSRRSTTPPLRARSSAYRQSLMSVARSARSRVSSSSAGLMSLSAITCAAIWPVGLSSAATSCATPGSAT